MQSDMKQLFTIAFFFSEYRRRPSMAGFFQELDESLHAVIYTVGSPTEEVRAARSHIS